MKFWEAMKALEEGEKICDNSDEWGGYIYQKDNEILDENGVNITLMIDKITDDWSIYEPRSPIMPFGRHKGTPISKLPIHYCEWILANKNPHWIAIAFGWDIVLHLINRIRSEINK